MSAAIKAIGHHDSCMYFGSIAKAAVAEDKMDSMDWTWVRPGSFMAHTEGPPFLLCKKVAVIHDEITFETIAEYPSLEAAVMLAELEGVEDGDIWRDAHRVAHTQRLNGR